MTFGSTCSGPSACTCSPEPPTTDGSSSVRCDDGPMLAAAPQHEGVRGCGPPTPFRCFVALEDGSCTAG
jgi:hypothetical protein